MSYGATSLLRASLLRSQLNAQSESRFLGSKLVVRITESSLLPSNIFQVSMFLESFNFSLLKLILYVVL